MEGHRGPLEITDLIELVDRNKYKPNVRWITGEGARANGSPSQIATCLVGSWITNTYGGMSQEHVTNYNVTTPFIPEHTIINGKTGRVDARGWRDIVTEMVCDRVIRPSREVEKILGREATDSARRSARTMA